MKFLNTRFYISMGLISLAVSIVLMSSVLGIFPDREAAVRDGRAALAETLAATASALVSERDVSRLQGVFNFVLKRNEDLRSVAVRGADGLIVVSAGPHEKWVASAANRSSDSHLEVPIASGKQKWGQLEMRFEPITPPGPLGLLHHPLLHFALYMALAGFFAFYFYLGRMLSQLDPSQAIPGRVRAALDTLAEGLLVIDRRQNIVLANEAFANLLGTTSDLLLGTQVSKLEWLAP